MDRAENDFNDTRAEPIDSCAVSFHPAVLVE